MRFVIQQSQMQAALGDLIGVVPVRTTFTILTNVLIDALEDHLQLTATDLDTFISISLPATIQEAGSLTAPAKMLLDLIKELDDEPVSFQTEEDTLTISCSSGNYSVQGIARTEFPQVDLQPQGEPSFRLKGEDISGLIRPVQFAASTEETRMILNGILLKAAGSKIFSAATDGHRLGYKSLERVVPPSLENGIVLPNKVLQHILHLAGTSTAQDVDIWVTPRNILLRSKGHLVYTRLVEGTYPAFEHVVPKHQPYRMEMETDKLLAIIRRAYVMANSATHQVRLNLSDNELTVAASNPNKGSTATEKAACEYEGEPMEISFNARYLMEILRQISTPRTKVTLDGPGQAGLFYPVDTGNEEEEYFCLLMPLRM